MNTPNALKSIIGKHETSRYHNSSISRNENVLKIADENDDTLDLGRDLTGTLTGGTADWLYGHSSKGFSLRTTPKNTIPHIEETDEAARMRRAYSKYSKNLKDWNKTIGDNNN